MPLTVSQFAPALPDGEVGSSEECAIKLRVGRPTDPNVSPLAHINMLWGESAVIAFVNCLVS